MELVKGDKPIYVSSMYENRMYTAICAIGCDNIEQAEAVRQAWDKHKFQNVLVNTEGKYYKGAELIDYASWFYEDYVSDLSEDKVWGIC